MKNETHYDYLIIGSGGGYKLTQTLARLGKKTALIEKDRAGGTCLNRGCIPSKMLIYPSGVRDKLAVWKKKMHLDVEWKGADFEALTRSIQAHTDGISDGLSRGFDETGHVDFHQGSAMFTGPKAVVVNGRTLTANTVVIATGSRPHIPDVPGLAGTPFMTSTEALRNREQPARLIVLGGGYIAAELGGAYAGFGVDVTYLLRSTFLRREDREVQALFARAFSEGKTIHEHTRLQKVDYRDGLFRVRALDAAQKPFEVEAEALLVATGIVPNADQLGLEHASVQVKPDGFIGVNDYLETSAPGVFAIGDVAGNYLFRHSVNFEAEYWVDAQLLADRPYPIQYPPMPSAVFTHPEIASVGLSEDQANAAGRDVVIGKAAYSSCAMAQARGLEEGFVKLIFERASGRLLGAHIIGDEASMLIQECVLALTHGMTMQDMYKQIYIHPAFPEVVRNAVRNAIRLHDPRRAVMF